MWEERAWEMALAVAPDSRSLWHDALISVPRHELVPRWLTSASSGSGGWEVADGPSDRAAWLDAAYDRGRTLATRAGAVHADHAAPGTVISGPVTGRAVAPALVVALCRHAMIYPGCDILEAGTGSAYGTALLAQQFGSDHVTSTDTDEYRTQAAAGRLGSLGLHPRLITRSPDDEMPGGYDRIISMAPWPAVPPSWLAALRPGGRLVLWLDGGVIITANTDPDGGADGQVEQDPSAFRYGTPAAPEPAPPPAPDEHGDSILATRSPFPVVDLARSWELRAMLAVTTPGLITTSRTDPQSGAVRTWLAHPDGSWAHAGGEPGEAAYVHQAGPRRLWELLDHYRQHWIAHGHLPVTGARVRITPGGTCRLSNGTWHATIPAQPGR